jgi:hypothetical protein
VVARDRGERLRLALGREAAVDVLVGRLGEPDQADAPLEAVSVQPAQARRNGSAL